MELSSRLMDNSHNAPVKKSIFIVEDDEEISFVLTFMLEREGFEVTTSKDGRDALNLIDSAPESDMSAHPDLVLLDIMLPHFDGIQVLTYIRNHPTWKRVPVVMLTAKSQAANIDEAFALGANEYITKPFQPDEVLVRIKRFLN